MVEFNRVQIKSENLSLLVSFEADYSEGEFEINLTEALLSDGTNVLQSDFIDYKVVEGYCMQYIDDLQEDGQ